MNDYTLFNLYEAVFWIILGIACYFGVKYLPIRYKNISLLSFFTLVLFGISDLVEIKTQGFLYPPVWWLLIWKGVCISAMLLIIIWYFRLRFKSD